MHSARKFSGNLYIAGFAKRGVFSIVLPASMVLFEYGGGVSGSNLIMWGGGVDGFDSSP